MRVKAGPPCPRAGGGWAGWSQIAGSLGAPCPQLLMGQGCLSRKSQLWPLHPLLELRWAQGWQPSEAFPRLVRRHRPGPEACPSQAAKWLCDIGQIPSPLWASNASSSGGVRLEHGSDDALGHGAQRGEGTESAGSSPLSVIQEAAPPPPHQASSSAGV